MSNDELQKAIDDITSGDAAASAATTDDTSATTTSTPADAGTATVTLPDDMAGNGMTAADALNFTETPDSATGATTDLFGIPPTPDTSTAMPAGAEESATNPATEAAPSVPEPMGTDPLVGIEPDLAALNTTPTTETAPISPVVAPEADTTASATEIPTTDALDTQTIADVTPSIKVAETAPLPSTDVSSVVDEAMKELYPLLDRVPSMTDKEKYEVCIKIGGDALPKALQYAKGISDEAEKAEALLKIIESAK